MSHTETARIADQLRRAVQGPAWHGPALAEAIAEVTADQAAARPLAGAHSIHELLAHAVAWIDIVRQRVEGRPPQVTAAMDWPPVSVDRWDRTVGELQTAAQALEQTIRELDDGRLTDEIPIDNDRWSVYQTLHGAIQHVLYHAGQIGVLKKGL
jgi:uncharacterized damage-inducible protein DinB